MSITDTNVSTDPTTAIVMTGLRDAVKLGGAYLVAQGAVSSSGVELYGGLIVIIGGVVWSGITSYLKHRNTAVATTAVRQLTTSDHAANSAMQTAAKSIAAK